MFAFILSLFFTLHFSKPEPALKAKDFDFLFVDEIYSFSSKNNKLFTRLPWISNSPRTYEFIYLHIANPEYITRIKPLLYGQNLLLFSNIPSHIKWQNDGYTINASPSILFFVFKATPDARTDIWTAKGKFVLDLHDSYLIEHLDFYNEKFRYPVFVLRRKPLTNSIKKFVELDDSLAIGLNKNYFFAVKQYHRAFWLLLAYRNKTKVKGTLLYFSQNGFSRRNVAFTYKYDDSFIYTPLGKVMYHVPDSAFVQPKQLDSNIVLDIRYATEKNFTRQKLYSCAQCWLRYAVAKDLIKAAKALNDLGFKIILYDCYRPISVQWKMWSFFPYKNYVAPPQKGSMHNRGVAVDLGLADEYGTPVDMGTDFDYFGPKAHSDYKKLPKKVLYNRKILRQMMELYGFKHIRTEWWHFYHLDFARYNLLNIDFCQSDKR